jgi:hypothetical protein
MRRVPGSLSRLGLAVAGVAFAALAAGCGAMEAPGPYVDAGPSENDASVSADAGPSFPDAGPPPDGGVSGDASVPPDCFDVAIAPPTGAAPTTITAQAFPNGFVDTPHWTVTGTAGEEIQYDLVDGNPLKIDFLALVHGTYHVLASPSCSGPETVEVAGSTAEGVMFFLHYAPRPGDPAPPQDDPDGFLVTASSTTGNLSTRMLRTGRVVHTSISDEVGTAGAQVTLTPVDGGFPVSLFAAADRLIDGVVLDARQHLVIVPGEGRLAPYVLDRDPLQLDGVIPFAPGQLLTGKVIDGGGAPVASAWVSIGAAGAPPALVPTDATGAFSIDVRHGNLRIEVAPAAGSGLPALLAPASMAVTADGGPLTIALAAATPVTLHDWQVMRSDHVSVSPGAHVTFVAAAAGAGKIAQAGVFRDVPASETRVRIDADDSGKLPDLVLPAARYDVVVEPRAATQNDVMAVTTVDLSGASGMVTRVLETVPPVQFGVQVLDADGVTKIAGAHVSAIGQGRLGVQKGEAVVVDADENGLVVAIPGAPEMIYDVVVDAPRTAGSGAVRARARKRIDSAHAAPIEDIRLPPAVQLSGVLERSGNNPAAGVTVSVRCGGQGCPDSSFVYAETVTDAQGKFRLAVPDLTRAP